MQQNEYSMRRKSEDKEKKPDNISEEQLLIALKNSDKKAYTLIYNRYIHPLRLHAKRFVEDVETAEDFAHDILLNLWEKRETLEITTSLKNYLFSSVKNACFDYKDRIDVVRKFEDSFLAENKDASDGYTPEDAMVTNEAVEEILRKLEALPPKDKEIIKLIRLEELSYKEAAKALNIPIGTVSNSLNRALEKLRKSLENEE